MSYVYETLAPGTYRVLDSEVAPEDRPSFPRHAKRTWFFDHWPQPDGTCMNCRARPGDYDPLTGTYACAACVAACALALSRMVP